MKTIPASTPFLTPQIPLSGVGASKGNDGNRVPVVGEVDREAR